jgi:hypothetical protein
MFTTLSFSTVRGGEADGKSTMYLVEEAGDADLVHLLRRHSSQLW